MTDHATPRAGSEPLDYGAAGVNLREAEESKRRIRRMVELTHRGNAVVGKFGGFGGMFRAPAGKAPVLVSSADGVGTKVKVAVEAGRLNTVGHDLVNHCVNDILVQGARPLFFLDYVAFGKLDAEAVEDVVAGVTEGCLENGCALVGGETAEMPGVYTPPDFDLAGFIVGVVEENAVLGTHRVHEDDVIVGLASTGLHTNGYSLARRIVRDRLHLGPNDPFPDHPGRTTADVLLAVHRSYLAAIEGVLGRVHGMAHITGGGIPGNVDRVLPPGLDAVIDVASWEVPPLFRVLAEAGGVARDEMLRTFNMGVGMCVFVPPAHVGAVLDAARSVNVPAWVMGEAVAGAGRVVFR